MDLHQVWVSFYFTQKVNTAKRTSPGYHELTISMRSSAGTTWVAWYSSGIRNGIGRIDVGYHIHSASASVAKSINHRALFGTPISGQLVGSYGYLALSMYAGASLVVGALLIFWAWLKLNKTNISKQWSCLRANPMLPALRVSNRWIRLFGNWKTEMLAIRTTKHNFNLVVELSVCLEPCELRPKIYVEPQDYVVTLLRKYPSTACTSFKDGSGISQWKLSLSSSCHLRFEGSEVGRSLRGWWEWEVLTRMPLERDGDKLSRDSKPSSIVQRTPSSKHLAVFYSGQALKERVCCREMSWQGRCR